MKIRRFEEVSRPAVYYAFDNMIDDNKAKGNKKEDRIKEALLLIIPVLYGHKLTIFAGLRPKAMVVGNKNEKSCKNRIQDTEARIQNLRNHTKISVYLR